MGCGLCVTDKSTCESIMLRPSSRSVRRAHSAPHSRIRSSPALPPSPTPIYAGDGKILYIDATPPSSVVSIRGDPDDESLVPTPSLINGRPIMQRLRHHSDQPYRINQKPIPVGGAPVAHVPRTDRRNSGSSKRRGSRHHHRSASNLAQIHKPGSWYSQPQVVSHWYELEDSSSQTSLGSDRSPLVPPQLAPPQLGPSQLAPPMLIVQPPSTHDLSIPEPGSSKADLDSYPPSPYEFDSQSVGPFSSAYDELHSVSASSSFYAGSMYSYIPSPLTYDAKTSVRSNTLHVPMSPISPYAVIRPKSPAPSIGSQISTSTLPIQSRPPQRQSTPMGPRRTHSDRRDHTRVNLMPMLNEEDSSAEVQKRVAQSVAKSSGSPGHNSQSLDFLDSNTTMSPVGEGLKKEGHSSSSPSLRVNGVDPTVFRFPLLPPPPSLSTGSRVRHLSSQSSRRMDYRLRTNSRLPHSTSQTSIQSLSLRSDVSASAGSMVSTRSDMLGGRRVGQMRFSRQYYSYRRPTVPSTRGQRTYRSFRQELLLRSMWFCV